MAKKLTKIQKYARGQDCTAMIDGCSPGPENETVVYCHGPRFHRGGMRADHWGAFCCMSCHDKLDGRTPWDGNRGRIKYGDEVAISAQVGFEKIETWFYAIEKTQSILIKADLIKLK